MTTHREAKKSQPAFVSQAAAREEAPAFRPLLAGSSRILNGEEARKITAELRDQLPDRDRNSVTGVSGLRALDLLFYDDATLYEGMVSAEAGKQGTIAFIRHRNVMSLLNGGFEKKRGPR